MTEKDLAPDELPYLMALRRDPEFAAPVIAGALAASPEELVKMFELKATNDRAGLLAYAQQLAARGKETTQ